MIKKIRQLDTYFLLHYPQLWNLRIVWMAPAIIILHILFYIAGYVYFSDNTQLHGGAQISQHMVSFGDLVFSELVGILLIILWLVFYLRNNPLKSFYPLPRWYWVIEVSVVFTILLGCTTLYTSFARGYWDSIDHHTKRVDLTDEVNTLNLAYGLLPVSDRDYSLHACCDSLHYTEGLAHDLRVIKERVDSVHHMPDGEMDADVETEVTSSVNAASNINGQLSQEERQARSDRRDSIIYGREYVIMEREQRAFGARDISDETYSYLNYCKIFYDYEEGSRYGHGIWSFRATTRHYGAYSAKHQDQDSHPLKVMNREEISARIQQLLTSQDKDGVTALLRHFDQICARYEISRDINISFYAARPFATPDYKIGTTISTSYAYGEHMDYVRFDDIAGSFDTILKARNLKFDYSFWLTIFFVTFSFTLVLYTYRVSSRRVWFIALIGSGILLVIFVLLMALLQGVINPELTFLIFTVTFYGLYHAFRSTGRKILAGVNLVWFTWSMPLIIHTLISYVKSKIPYNMGRQMEHPLRIFLDRYDNQILTIYFILIVLYAVTLLARRYKNWQSMPEE